MINQWHNETIGMRVVEVLKQNNFDAIYFAEKEEAVEYVMGYIDNGATVGMGGSVTLNELKIMEKAQAKGAVVLNHDVPGLSHEEKVDIRLNSELC
ncbi:MAG: LUD domain-containing protein [Bacillota bacterium]